MRSCVVGIGSIGPSHINALCALGENIVALCDLKTERCEAARERFGLDCLIYTDYIKMLDEVKPDVVHICLPHYLHVDYACEALSRGINVLSEKPIGISLSQLEKLKCAVENSSATLGVCHQNRYNSSVRYLKELFEGETVLCASGTLVWERDGDYYTDSDWRGRMETEGGGVMINQALHTLDLLQWFCGMPDKVTATVSNNTHRGMIDVEDTAFGVFKVGERSRFIVTATNCANHSYPVSFNFSTENHSAALIGDTVIVDGAPLTKSDGKPLCGKAVYGNGHLPLINDFYDCLRSGRKFPLDVYEAEKVIKLILAMYRSNGEEIDV